MSLVINVNVSDCQWKVCDGVSSEFLEDDILLSSVKVYKEKSNKKPMQLYSGSEVLCVFGVELVIWGVKEKSLLKTNAIPIYESGSNIEVIYDISFYSTRVT